MASKAENKTDSPVKITIYPPASLLARIDQEVDQWNKAHPKSPETRSDRITYLLEYAYDAGNLSHFIDLMKSQYLEILATTPQQIAAGAATYNQADLINYRLNDIDDKLQELTALLQK